MRINNIPPWAESDSHLMAEIREIKMLPKTLCKSLRSKSGFNWKRIPTKYKLNTGHGLFFYDKIPYIERRFKMLIEEGLSRGLDLQEKTTNLYDPEYDYSIIDKFKNRMTDWEPDYEAMTVCVARIMDRIEEKVFRDNQPNFYKMLKKNVSYEEWKDYYNKFLFFANKNTKLERIA